MHSWNRAAVWLRPALPKAGGYQFLAGNLEVDLWGCCSSNFYVQLSLLYLQCLVRYGTRMLNYENDVSNVLRMQEFVYH